MNSGKPDIHGTDRECHSFQTVYLRECFRMLWERHVYWARIVIKSIILDLPGLEASTERLLRNASDFGRVVCHYYGKIAASEFTCLLRDHFLTGAELVRVSKTGNLRLIEEANRRWYENAESIACFQSHLNPCWSYEEMKTLWFRHLGLTKQDAEAILENDYERSIMIFNQVEEEALLMADEFARGIDCHFEL